MPFGARFCTSEVNACELTGAHFSSTEKGGVIEPKKYNKRLEYFFFLLFHVEFERKRTEQRHSHFPTGTLSWSGGESLCSRSGAELMAGGRGRRSGHKRMSSGVYF